jgi:signal transduction histidine kinase
MMSRTMDTISNDNAVAATRMLRNLNGALKMREGQLAAANERIAREIERRKRVECALRDSNQSLRRLAKEAVIAREEERKRISRELHDEVGQALTAISVGLAKFKSQKPGEIIETQIADLQELLEQTMEKIHGFTRELRPAMLEHLGLIPALQAYVRSFSARSGMDVGFRAHPEAENLGPDEKLVLYRASQEGLTNVLKHAQATRAAVVISKNGSIIRMEVRDNGKSFAGLKNGGGMGKQRLGLLGIEERVRLVNGKFQLRSAAGVGTTLQVEVPYKTAGTKTNQQYGLKQENGE